MSSSAERSKEEREREGKKGCPAKARRPVSEEDAAAEEDVGRAGGEAVDAIDQGPVEPLAPELVDQLVVVYLPRHLPRVHLRLRLPYRRRRSLLVAACALLAALLHLRPSGSTSRGRGSGETRRRVAVVPATAAGGGWEKGRRDWRLGGVLCLKVTVGRGILFGRAYGPTNPMFDA